MSYVKNGAQLVVLTDNLLKSYLDKNEAASEIDESEYNKLSQESRRARLALKEANAHTVIKSPKNRAWASLRDNADLDGSWPELKASLNKAVDSLDEDATAAAIYDKAVELLS